MSTSPRKFTIHEDWVVVILGFLIIFLALGGVKPLTPSFNWNNAEELRDKVFSAANLSILVVQFVFVLLIACIGVFLTGRSLKYFIYSFPVVYILAMLAMILAGNQQVKALNLEAVIFSLTLGLIVGNFFKLPEWFRSALSTELFVKIGLVILGSSIIFGDILEAGAYGLLQAVVVVLSVWYFAFWLCKKMKIDRELTMMISSAVSICGVTAAIAASGAIKGDSKKLSYVISLVLITAIPMMIGMPFLAQYMGLSQEVTGAWIGGSIDTTGAVVASGTLVGETALKISAIVKFSQNVLLGIAAFAISIYWAYTNTKGPEGEFVKPSVSSIWERFPKFVLGFVAASLLFSFFIDAQTVDGVKSGLKNMQNLWFVLAFTSIGLETNFSDLLKSSNRKPLYAFLIAQTFNVLVTLAIAYFLFG
ncbi:MAG: putative sulfate exporter family transporter [Chitinophagaceae bacterium]|nr:putative sulfate exporter family transporter [Chitinophagaceae bacterium]